MFVRDDWTRHGLGRRIIDECETAARREGFRRLALLATLPGVPLYRACGFEPIEDLRAGGLRRRPVPCVSMEKSIPGAHLDSPTDASQSQNAAHV